MMERIHQPVDIFFRIIHRNRGARGRRHVKSVHQRLGAVVPRPHGNAGAVDDHADVMGMRALDHEGKDTSLIRGRTDQPEFFHFLHPLGGISQKRAFMGQNIFPAEPVHIIERRAEADGLHDGRRARLETVRRVGIGDPVHGDLTDHFTAAPVGAHLLQMLALGIKRADAARPVNLVACQRKEIAIEVLHIDGQMHRRLRAVHHHRNAALMRHFHDALHRRDGAERIRHMGERQ